MGSYKCLTAKVQPGRLCSHEVPFLSSPWLGCTAGDGYHRHCCSQHRGCFAPWCSRCVTATAPAGLLGCSEADQREQHEEQKEAQKCDLHSAQCMEQADSISIQDPRPRAVSRSFSALCCPEAPKLCFLTSCSGGMVQLARVEGQPWKPVSVGRGEGPQGQWSCRGSLLAENPPPATTSVPPWDPFIREGGETYFKSTQKGLLLKTNVFCAEHLWGDQKLCFFSICRLQDVEATGCGSYRVN